MKILLIHPHDIFSSSEPWTSRIRNIAQELFQRGHAVRLAYFIHSSDRGHNKTFPLDCYALSRSKHKLLATLNILNELCRWADVVHVQKCCPYAALPTLWACHTARKPLHYDWDDYEAEISAALSEFKLGSAFIRFFERRMISLVDTISVASTALHNRAITWGAPAKNVWYARGGVDADVFHPDSDSRFVYSRYQLTKPVVLYMGQLNHGQYVKQFIDALVEVKKNRDVTGMVVGGGTALTELKEYAAVRNVANNMVFTGAVTHEEVPAYIQAAAVAVACFDDSLLCRCKSPLKVLEYMACGKAIVASAVGEVSTMVGDCAVLTKPGDVADLARGIVTLLHDEETRSALGMRARKRVCATYTWQQTVDNLLAAYERAQQIQRDQGAC